MAAAEAGGEEGGSGAAGEPGAHCPPPPAAAVVPRSSPIVAAAAPLLGPRPSVASPAPQSHAAASRPPAEMSKASPLPLTEGGGGGVPGGFPPLPPPPQPPLPTGGLSTVDEGDSLDGPEYEEEEVAIPLNAPPTNQ